jgi:TonB-linked SusC/RagA family outer membrane protein
MRLHASLPLFCSIIIKKTIMKRLQRLWLLCSTLLLLFHLAASAQESTLHGIITDENGKPLSGATVRLKGSNKATTTDENGNYTLKGVSPSSTLIVSYVGFKDQEVKTGSSGQLNVNLISNRNSLDDVVVIGYGTAKKKDLVSSTDVIAAKDAGNTASTNPSELLIGKAAGVQVLQSSGTPGSDAQIIIRGTGSFTSVDPLYVIDGIQADKNVFNALSAQDIENITILKDAASTAIYGVAGANGVVIITTKKGKPGAPHISFTSQWGMAKAWKQLHLLNASQYVDLLEDFAATSNTTLPAKFSTPNVRVDSTDWQKAIFQTALVSENDIALTGGSDKVLYNLSVGYITQEATIKSLINKRLNIRMGLDEHLGRFHFGQSVTFRNTNTKGQTALPQAAIQYAPYKPIHDTSVLGGYSILANVTDFSNAANPLQLPNVQIPITNEYVMFPQAFAEVNIYKGLMFRSQFSAEIGTGRYTEYQYPYVASNFLAYPRQSIMTYNDYSEYTIENYFSYNHTFGRHSIGATLGNSYLAPGNSATLGATGSNIANDNLQNISVSQTQAVTTLGYNYARASTESYYGRLIYTYDGKYTLSASGRRDGSSNFGSNYQFGNFYGVGGAWNFGEESFMKGVSNIISNGKLRIGYGVTGNDNIPSYQTTPLTFSGSPTGNLVYSLGSTEAYVPGTTIATVSNPNLRWEQTGQLDIGLEMDFLQSRLHLDVDYYNRKSNGLLVEIPLPASVGADLTGANPQEYENAADAYNRGVEFTLGWRDHVGRDFNYSVGVNGAFNKNDVTSLGSQFVAPILAGTFDNLSTFTITQAGSPIGSFYGYQVDHVAKDQAEIDALNAAAVKKTGNPAAVYQQGLLPGDFIFKDLSGDGTVTSADQKVLGNPIPKFIYGANLSMNYKNWDLNIVGSGVAGLKLLNSNKFVTEIEATGHNATTAILNRWRQSGDVAALPRAGQDATSSGNLRPSDWWLESGNYFRLRNITLGYTIPSRMLNGFAANAISRIRIYVAAQNLFTITKYSGYDPEISTQQSQATNYIFTRGIDDGALPQPRTFIAGLQLGF